MELEKDFFNEIAPKILELNTRIGRVPAIIAHKGDRNDVTTQIDIAVEQLILDRISELFPADAVLAEETHSILPNQLGRVWIIDPICGTANLGRGVPIYCSNIALADNGRLVASCIVDFAEKTYYWSTGDGTIWNEHVLYTRPEAADGVLVDVDLGSAIKATPEMKSRHLEGIRYLQSATDYMLCSFNSSLDMLYVALGRLDGAHTMSTRPWDVAAAAFLMQQAGIVAGDQDGHEFSFSTAAYTAARSQEIYRVLRHAFDAIS